MKNSKLIVNPELTEEQKKELLEKIKQSKEIDFSKIENDSPYFKKEEGEE